MRRIVFIKRNMKLKTWWQGLKYWQKGGIIGALVPIILLALSFFCVSIISGDESIFCTIPLVPISFFFVFDILVRFDFLPNKIVMIFYYLFSIVIYFLIGALIGLIIGKLKKK
jgi:hypothetical protein